MYLDLLAAVSFYLFPFLLGLLFTRKPFLAFAIGALGWFITYLLLGSILNALHLTDFFPKLISLFAVSISLASILKVFKKPPPISILHRGFLFLCTGFIFFTAIFFLIWRYQTPYPLSVNWDIYEHINLANRVSNGQVSFLPSSISDTFTFNSYSTLFHCLLSLPEIVFHTNLLGVYWWLEYLHYLLSIFATYLLAKKLFNNPAVSFLSAVFSGLVFESSIVYSSFFLIPQTLAALLTAFAILDTDNLRSSKVIALPILLILLTHFVLGPLGVCIFLAFVFSRKVLSQFPKLPNILFFSALIILALSTLSNLVGSVTLTTREEALHFNFSLLQKMGFLLDWYSISLLVFLPIAAVKIFLGKEYPTKVLLILALLLTAISLAPFSYFLKFYSINHYLISPLLAYGGITLMENFPSLLYYFGITWISISMIVVFYANQLSFKSSLLTSGLYSNLSESEIDASQWLLKTYSKKSFLVSDPATQYILEALSGTNSQGGAYMSLQTRQSLSQIDSIQDVNVVKNNLLAIHDNLSQENKLLFVVGGRYFAWQRLPQEWKNSFYYNLWTPEKIQIRDLTYLNFLTGNFKEVYQNDELAIFEIK